MTRGGPRPGAGKETGGTMGDIYKTALEEIDALSWSYIGFAQFPDDKQECEVLVDGVPVSIPNKAVWDEDFAAFEFGFGDYLDMKSGSVSWRPFNPQTQIEIIVRKVLGGSNERR